MKILKISLFALFGLFVLSLPVWLLSETQKKANVANGNVDLIEAQVETILPDTPAKGWLVLLSDKVKNKKEKEAKFLAIGVGETEGAAILLGLSKKNTPRPLTHELFAKILKQTGVSLVNCVIHTVNRNTFFARLDLARDGHTFSMDARPSDAMALTLRMEGKIFVKRKVFDEAGIAWPPKDNGKSLPKEEPL